MIEKQNRIKNRENFMIYAFKIHQGPKVPILMHGIVLYVRCPFRYTSLIRIQTCELLKIHYIQYISKCIKLVNRPRNIFPIGKVRERYSIYPKFGVGVLFSYCMSKKC